jgi:hypothetical protein
MGFYVVAQIGLAIVYLYFSEMVTKDGPFCFPGFSCRPKQQPTGVARAKREEWGL